MWSTLIFFCTKRKSGHRRRWRGVYLPEMTCSYAIYFHCPKESILAALLGSQQFVVVFNINASLRNWASYLSLWLHQLWTVFCNRKHVQVMSVWNITWPLVHLLIHSIIFCLPSFFVLVYSLTAMSVVMSFSGDREKDRQVSWAALDERGLIIGGIA